jgi:hypothetical protein
MKWGGFAVIAALALASCAFSSERALFADSDGVAPIADGAMYDWQPSNEADEDFVVRFTSVGAAYELRPVGQNSERPMQVLFVDVPQTPENDYVAQVIIDADRPEAFAYAYLWPTGADGFRVFAQPSAFDEDGELHGVEGYCTPASYSACTFTRGEDVLRYYRDVLYPAFRSGHIPASYLNLTPAAGPAPARKP